MTTCEEKNDECMKKGLKEEINSIAKTDAHRRRIMNEWKIMFKVQNLRKPNIYIYLYES